MIRSGDDPMGPSQHFDKPGKSPFMDMELVPKYADEAGSGETGVAIDPSRTQSLGLRIAEARTGTLGSSLAATGTIEFNERDIAIVQARTGGFVQRVYRSEEHTSELQSLMRISYAVFGFKKNRIN